MSYFTEQQIQEIRERILEDYSVRDTEFDNASAITGSEYAAIVQNGVNRKMTLQALADYIASDIGSIERSISISSEGTWVIDGTDTGIVAVGPTGNDGNDGNDGSDGANGTSAGFGLIDANVSYIDTKIPSVSVSTSGSNASKNIHFEFRLPTNPVSSGSSSSGSSSSSSSIHILTGSNVPNVTFMGYTDTGSNTYTGEDACAVLVMMGIDYQYKLQTFLNTIYPNASVGDRVIVRCHIRNRNNYPFSGGDTATIIAAQNTYSEYNLYGSVKVANGTWKSMVWVGMVDNGYWNDSTPGVYRTIYISSVNPSYAYVYYNIGGGMNRIPIAVGSSFQVIDGESYRIEAEAPLRSQADGNYATRVTSYIATGDANLNIVLTPEDKNLLDVSNGNVPVDTCTYAYNGYPVELQTYTDSGSNVHNLMELYYGGPNEVIALRDGYKSAILFYTDDASSDFTTTVNLTPINDQNYLFVTPLKRNTEMDHETYSVMAQEGNDIILYPVVDSGNAEFRVYATLLIQCDDVIQPSLNITYPYLVTGIESYIHKVKEPVELGSDDTSIWEVRIAGRVNGSYLDNAPGNVFGVIEVSDNNGHSQTIKLVTERYTVS